MSYNEYMEQVRHFRGLGFDPDDYEHIADYFRTIAAAIRDAQKLKQLMENHKLPSIRDAAQSLYQIKYDFGVAFATDEDRKKEILRFERTLSKYYTCEVPSLKK